MRHRRDAAHTLGEQRTEGRSRLDPLIPFLGNGIFVPVDLAKIVEHGHGRGRCQIGIAQPLARQPLPPETVMLARAGDEFLVRQRCQRRRGSRGG